MKGAASIERPYEEMRRAKHIELVFLWNVESRRGEHDDGILAYPRSL